jgi:hypothetical protein
MTLNNNRSSTIYKLFIHVHEGHYPLILAQVKEYVRASQTRLLLQPVAERLVAQLGARGAEHRLKRILARLRAAPPTPGYAAANLLHLLLQLDVNLRGYDFSHLYFRQLYLRGARLPQTNFAQAEVVDSVFTEPFGLIYAVAFSPDGQYWASGWHHAAVAGGDRGDEFAVSGNYGLDLHPGLKPGWAAAHHRRQGGTPVAVAVAHGRIAPGGRNQSGRHSVPGHQPGREIFGQRP